MTRTWQTGVIALRLGLISISFFITMLASVATAAPAKKDPIEIAPPRNDVDYDRPTPAVIKQCTIRQEELVGISALVVRYPRDKLLQAFAATRGDRVVGHWSLFKRSVEFHRDIDTDFDIKADQSGPPDSPNEPVGGGGACDRDPHRKISDFVARLRAIEREMAETPTTQHARLASERLDILEQVLDNCADVDRGFWTKQLAETLAAFVHAGLAPDGVVRLERLGETISGDEQLSALIAFLLAQSRYAADMRQPDVDGQRVQARWFDDLSKLVIKHPEAPETAEALLQLAFRDEFEGREHDAVRRYGSIVEQFPELSAASKAAGAIRRLQLVGKHLELSGSGLNGEEVSAVHARGVPAVIYWWSTKCEACKDDINRIRELRDRFGRRTFAVIGISLDDDKTQLSTFLQKEPMPWPLIHEPEGLDSKLAAEFGVLVVPTMFLLDADGKVVNRNANLADVTTILMAQRTLTGPSTPEGQAIIVALTQAEEVWALANEEAMKSRVFVRPEVWDSCMSNLLAIKTAGFPADFSTAWEAYILSCKERCDALKKAGSAFDLTAAAVNVAVTGGAAFVGEVERSRESSKAFSDAVVRLKLAAKRHGIE